mmetsp:Transcript_57423/g.136493  ORF Transcript_57423/g.136493 Transcript_57423/m.136493 type:complete len:214 (+) Transcript_57423:110-751(+)|eukprot:CAMPEP_0178421096 /NCGR_PEP_ID=MMETSP0689_2-20121128/26473_1 /TAXON_ID=160604 /ORGANISM="Amphidinium massartii, Strain CS-259" /LENGTH=213 /DNA_ID=CAMNT_0020042601 /DNA_START=97 /DNA_END=738 /DNA_ORIENTATION=-
MQLAGLPVLLLSLLCVIPADAVQISAVLTSPHSNGAAASLPEGESGSGDSTQTLLLGYNGSALSAGVLADGAALQASPSEEAAPAASLNASGTNYSTSVETGARTRFKGASLASKMPFSLEPTSIMLEGGRGNRSSAASGELAAAAAVVGAAYVKSLSSAREDDLPPPSVLVALAFSGLLLWFLSAVAEEEMRTRKPAGKGWQTDSTLTDSGS